MSKKKLRKQRTAKTSTYLVISCIPSRVIMQTKHSIKPLKRAPGTSSPIKRKTKHTVNRHIKMRHSHNLSITPCGGGKDMAMSVIGSSISTVLQDKWNVGSIGKVSTGS